MTVKPASFQAQKAHGGNILTSGALIRSLPFCAFGKGQQPADFAALLGQGSGML